MIIPQETIQKVINTSDIVEVVGNFVSLHKSGSNYKGLCPFHNEKTPSFMVSPAKQIFKCFGCGESGNSVSFLMKLESMSFIKSIKWLAEKYNIEIQEKELTSDELASFKENETIYLLNSFAQKYFSSNLKDSEEGQDIAYSYFRSRGFSASTIDSFQLGYCFNKRDGLFSVLTAQGYSPDIVEKAGLIISKEADNIFSFKKRYFDRFRDRVIFPIHSLSGQILGFGGRTLRKDKKTAKYINSPETPVYNKSRTLYGMYFARNQIVRADKCYLVEGYTDVISMHQAGIKNVVASSGTSLTEEQIRLIRRFSRNLTLIFDGDAAGLNAAKRGIDLSLKEGMNVRLITMPENEDPDSFCRHTPISDIREYFEKNEKDFILFKIGLIEAEDLLDPIKKSSAIKDVINSISNVSDIITRDNYIKAASRLLDTSQEIIYSEMNKFLDKTAQKQKKVRQQLPISKQTPEIPRGINTTSIPEEKQLIYFLIKFGQEQYRNNISVSEFIINEMETEGGFNNVVFREIFDIYKDNLKKSDIIDVNFLLGHSNQNIRKVVEEIISNDYQLSVFWENKGTFVLKPEDTYKNDVLKTLIAFKLRILGLFLKKIQSELDTNNLTEDEITAKLKLSQTAIHARQKLMDIYGLRHIY